MPNYANTAEFRVGRSADVLHVQFYAHVIYDVKTKISGRRRKRDFTATDSYGIWFRDWKGLGKWAQEEGLYFIIVKFKFVFQHPGLDVWQTCFQRRYCRLNVRWRDKDLKLSIIRERSRLNRVTMNQVGQKFCVEDEENWAKHRTLWHTIGKAWDLQDVVIDDEWLCSICQRRTRPGECSTRDVIHVLESVEKYSVVSCVKGSWKIQESQKRNIAGIKCKKDVICYFAKGMCVEMQYKTFLCLTC